MFDVHVITCLQTAPRLPETLRSMQQLINNKQIQQVKLFCKSDIGFYEEKYYTRVLWERQIKQIYPLLAKNIRDASSRKEGYLLNLLDLGPSHVFPKRELSCAEKSLLAKHYESLRSVSRTTLVLEDDCHIRHGCEENIIKVMELCTSKNLYADLGNYEGLSKRGKHAIYGGVEYYSCKIAMTRTTAAFVLNPYVANKLANGYWPCSLPADLHHQQLLLNGCIQGVWPKEQLTNHLSIEGKVKSLIQED